MELGVFIFFMAGILAEIILLWESAHPVADNLAWNRITAFPLRRSQLALGVIGVLTAALALLFAVLGIANEKVYIDTPVIYPFSLLLGLFIFGAGLFTDELVPRVNEKGILMVQVLVIASLLTSQTPLNGWLLAFGVIIPASLALFLAFNRQALPPLVKAGVFFLYLISLIVQTFLSGSVALFSYTHYNFVEAFLFGSTFLFLILHILLAIRYFLIFSSLILPRNRRLVRLLMLRLFSDEQVSPRSFLLFTVVLFALLAVNLIFDLLETGLVFNLGVIASVQVLSRRPGLKKAT